MDNDLEWLIVLLVGMCISAFVGYSYGEHAGLSIAHDTNTHDINDECMSTLSKAMCILHNCGCVVMNETMLEVNGCYND
jgi:hypothetical protein